MFSVPILYCTFNRIDTVKESFPRIRAIQPEKLYISSDGPRDGNSDDSEKINTVRQYLATCIDWQCEVVHLYSNTNMGCGIKMCSSISQAFEKEEKLIIIEDDCVADKSFFYYCEELLERYKDDERVMLIDGYRNSDIQISKDSYFFSATPEDYWGWATWKRVWEQYDYDIEGWKEKDVLPYLRKVSSRGGVEHFCSCLDTVFTHKRDIWDYQLLHLLLTNHALGIFPNTNMIRNCGISSNATHTFEIPQYFNENNYTMSFPLKHPESIRPAKNYDKVIWRIPFYIQIIRSIKKLLGLDPNKSLLK